MYEQLRRSAREVETRLPGFNIEQGLRPGLLSQLVKKSRQPAIRQHCPRDADERFKDVEVAMRWLQKDREVYALMPKTDLAGVIWYGQEQFPLQPEGVHPFTLPQHTFAIRLYDKYAGRGLARQFMDDTLVDYIKTIYLRGLTDEVRGIWLSAQADNDRALSLYHDYGYEHVGGVDRDGVRQNIMVLSNPKITQKISGA